jgi:hypothetical protein
MEQFIFPHDKLNKLMFHYAAHNNTQFNYISDCRIARGGVAMVTVRSVDILGSLKRSRAASETIFR